MDTERKSYFEFWIFTTTKSRQYWPNTSESLTNGNKILINLLQAHFSPESHAPAWVLYAHAHTCAQTHTQSYSHRQHGAAGRRVLGTVVHAESSSSVQKEQKHWGFYYLKQWELNYKNTQKQKESNSGCQTGASHTETQGNTGPARRWVDIKDQQQECWQAAQSADNALSPERCGCSTDQCSDRHFTVNVKKLNEYELEEQEKKRLKTRKPFYSTKVQVGFQ